MLPKTAKIMIVDDMKMIRTSIRKYLNTLGYENIVEAVDGEDAVKKYASEKPAFIFMDVVMPNIPGDAALKIIREGDKKTPVVMLTSVAEKSVMDACTKEGILGYILKPLTLESGPKILADMLEKA